MVGDFDPAELEALALSYVGTVEPRPPPQPLFVHPISFRNPALPERHQTWHLKVGSGWRALTCMPREWGL